MRNRVVLGLVGICLPAIVHAEPIWDKVEFGMDRTQVELNYPKSSKVDYQKKAIEISDVRVVDGCDAEVNIRFDDSQKVESIMIAGNPSMGGRCSDRVLTNLAAKYGQPASSDQTQGSILARQGKISVWSRPDGTAMRFKKFESGGLGGGGFGKASWELTYTRLAGGFTL